MSRRSDAIVCVAFAILLLGGLYWGLQATLRGPDPEVANVSTYELSVSAPRPGEESPVFKAAQGDTVTLVIGSDRPGQIDVHGYEKKINLNAGGEVTLTFIATVAGVFPLHLHEPFDPPAPDGSMNHRHMATLEVQPR